jgi:hypothetical protein
MLVDLADIPARWRLKNLKAPEESQTGLFAAFRSQSKFLILKIENPSAPGHWSVAGTAAVFAAVSGMRDPVRISSSTVYLGAQILLLPPLTGIEVRLFFRKWHEQLKVWAWEGQS